MSDILEDVSLGVEIPDVDHAVVGAGCYLLASYWEGVPVRVEGDGVNLVLVALEGAEEFGVFLLLDHCSLVLLNI